MQNENLLILDCANRHASHARGESAPNLHYAQKLWESTELTQKIYSPRVAVQAVVR